jgi:hypothetical protein
MSGTGKKGFDWSMFPGCLTLVTFVIAVFAVPPAFFLNNDRMIARATGVTSGGRTLAIVTVPGYPAGLDYEAGKSLKGLWGSDDLALTIVNPASGDTVAIQEMSMPRSWVGNIMAFDSEKQETAYVGGKLLLPVGTPPGAYVGRLAGLVALPVEAGADAFELHEVTVDVPVSITVLSADEAVTGERAQSRTMVIGGGIATVVLFAITALIMRLQQQK